MEPKKRFAFFVIVVLLGTNTFSQLYRENSFKTTSSPTPTTVHTHPIKPSKIVHGSLVRSRIRSGPPTITKEPESIMTWSGTTVVFSVEATGEPTLLYTWQKNAVPIPGLQENTITLVNIKVEDTALFRCIVSNAKGSDTSINAQLTVKKTATIDSQPKNIRVYTGQKATLSLKASGDGTLTYQWQRILNSQLIDLPNATKDTLRIESADTTHKGTYQCKVSNGGGNVISSPATIDVVPSLIITTNLPQNMETWSDRHVTLSITASGEGTISYQWYKGQSPLPSAIAPTFSIASATVTDSGLYYCVVKNNATQLESNKLRLQVFQSAVALSISADTTVFERDSVIKKVSYKGKEPVAFRWFHNQIEIPNTNNNILAFQSTVADSGRYACVVSNPGASSVSPLSALHVKKRVSLTKDLPAHDTAYSKKKYLLALQATGPGTILYQWQKNKQDLKGATQSLLSFDTIQMQDSGAYRCRAWNSETADTSNEMYLTIYQSASITTQPVTSVSKNIGDTAIFSVSVTGDNPLFFQWFKNDTLIQKAVNCSLVLPAVTPTNIGIYTCKTGNKGDTLISSEAFLLLEQGPSHILKHPKDSAFWDNHPFSLTVVSSGLKPLLYQWQRNGIDIDEANDDTLRFSSVTSLDSGSYRCIVWNYLGTDTSNSSHITIMKAVHIIQQPKTKHVLEGDSVTFEVKATGTPPLTYQWFFNSLIQSDKKENNFTITNVSHQQVGTYFCLISNTGSVDTTTYAALKIDSSTITLKRPNGKENWIIKDTQRIVWTSHGTIGKVKIELSMDDGLQWQLIADSVDNTGSYLWQVPPLLSVLCKVRISNPNEEFGWPYDQSDSVFTIQPKTAIMQGNQHLISAEEIRIYPNPVLYFKEYPSTTSISVQGKLKKRYRSLSLILFNSLGIKLISKQLSTHSQPLGVWSPLFTILPSELPIKAIHSTSVLMYLQFQDLSGEKTYKIVPLGFQYK